MKQPRLLVEDGGLDGVAGDVRSDVIQRDGAQVVDGRVRPPAIRPLPGKVEQS